MRLYAVLPRQTTRHMRDRETNPAEILLNRDARDRAWVAAGIIDAVAFTAFVPWTTPVEVDRNHAGKIAGEPALRGDDLCAMYHGAIHRQAQHLFMLRLVGAKTQVDHVHPVFKHILR